MTDKAPTYPALIESMEDHAYLNQPVKHINQKCYNNCIEPDHAALKRSINPGKGFKSLRTTKKTLLTIEAFRTIYSGDIVKPFVFMDSTALRLFDQV